MINMMGLARHQLLDLSGEAVLPLGDLPEIAFDCDVDRRPGAVAIAAADGIVVNVAGDLDRGDQPP